MRRSLWLLAVTAACTDGGGTASLQAGPPAAVIVVVGDSQTAPVHTQLPAAIRVRVNDAQGRAVPDQLVNFVVTAGGGSVFAGASQTDDQGEALDFWTLGDGAGTQQLEARAIENGVPVVLAAVTAIAQAGPLASAQFTAETLVVVEGDQVVLPIAATDAYGNSVPAPQATMLDAIGLLLGDTWMAARGRARAVLPGDTLVLFGRLKDGPLTMTYQVGGESYTARADLEWDATGTASACTNSGGQGAGWFTYAGASYEVWNADSSLTFSFGRLENFFCQDTQVQQPAYWMTYYYPQQPGGPFLGTGLPLQLYAEDAVSLTFSSGVHSDVVTVGR